MLRFHFLLIEPKTQWNQRRSGTYRVKTQWQSEDAVVELDVAVSTRDSAGGANQSYWGEAGAGWSFIGNGTVQFNAKTTTLQWIPAQLFPNSAAQVVPPASWLPYNFPVPEALTPLTANNITNMFIFV
jgi:hypothetical protein